MKNKLKMRYSIFHITVLLLLLASCNKESDVPVPGMGPISILDKTYPLEPDSKQLIEGVYKVTSGSAIFGEFIVLKSNRTAVLFACNNGIYFIMEAGRLDSLVVLQGYWRDGYGVETGLCNMFISREEGGSMIAGGAPQKVFIRGGYGEGNNLPDQALTLEFLRPFSQKVKNMKFNILAHRGGGRTADHLPVSENSIGMINFTEKLGSTGIEIDVRLTNDNVPFIYHDNDINTRLTQKGPLAGPINKYSWQQLSSFIRLINGEKIPSLEDALIFVVDSTLLNFVYLDIKETNPSVSVISPIQHRILERAGIKGRNLEVVIGIPNKRVMDDFMLLQGYRDIPSLCELTVKDTKLINSKVWAPRWTMGTQNELVRQVHDEGRYAFCWTIDNQAWIEDFINNGLFDGLLTNFPYVVAYYHYIQD
jgi:glycerophosphoryl diester phosphodiesterase